MKLFTHYSRTYTSGYSISNTVYNLLKNLDSFSSINGIYTAHPDYVEQSKLGVFSNGGVLTWYNALQDGNYLFSVTNNPNDSPVLIEQDSLFNNNPSIDFRNEGDTSLRYRFPVEVGTIFIIYMTRDNGAYLIYAPRETFAVNQSDRLTYDAFVPGAAGTLWASQVIENNFNDHVYLADSRINGIPVEPTTFIVENVARLLCVSNFNTPNNKERISGYGGRKGDLGGTEIPYPLSESKSVKGRIAAIVTYKEVLPVEQIQEIEQILLNLYIDYSGTVLTEDVKLKGIVGVPFAYDFETVTLDEFYTIESWELISPLDIGLSFVGSVLQGTPSRIYDDTISIKITNSNGNEALFDIPTFLCRRDPILNHLPQLNNVVLVLSSGKDALDDGTYGVIAAPNNQLIEWDDARRLVNKSIVRQLVDPDIPNIFKPVPTYISNDPVFNSEPVVNFTNANNVLISNTPFEAQTFLWVYFQPNYGNRQLLNTFPDIKGTGELWTIANTSQVHGTTPVTALDTRVHKVPVNTLTYKLPTGTVYFITAKSTTGSISFSGFEGLFGKLAFFCSWSTVLSDAELIDFIPFLTERYYSDFSPFIFSEASEFKYASPISIDLNFKVVDLRNEELSYVFVENNYSATIDSNGILSFSTTSDETLNFSIDVTNESDLTSNLSFKVEVILKTNPLYLDIRNNFSNLKAFYIALNETITYSSLVVNSWADYRNTGQELTSTSVTTVFKYELDNKLTTNFNVDGSDFFDINTPSTISGKCFILGYIRKQAATGRALLFGQDNGNGFISGTGGILWDTSSTSSDILNGTTYINGREVSNTYLIRPEVLNTIIINTVNEISFDTIAKDRSFTDRSVKGFIPFICVLQENISSSSDAKLLDTLIRNYYDTPKKIVQLPFNNSLVDIGDRSKTVTGSLDFDTIFKFGGHSKLIAQNTSLYTVSIPNDSDFAFLTADFTISFWLYITNTLGTGDSIILYNQPDLVIFIQGNTLYVSRNSFVSEQLISYTLPSTVFTENIFHLIQLGRKDNQCYFFFDGVLRGTYQDFNEYFDYNTPVVLGGGTLSSTGVIKVLIDDFVVFRRKCLNTTSFNLPTSPY